MAQHSSAVEGRQSWRSQGPSASSFLLMLLPGAACTPSLARLWRKGRTTELSSLGRPSACPAMAPGAFVGSCAVLPVCGVLAALHRRKIMTQEYGCSWPLR